MNKALEKFIYHLMYEVKIKEVKNKNENKNK